MFGKVRGAGGGSEESEAGWAWGGISDLSGTKLGLCCISLVAQPTKKNKVLWEQSGKERNDKSGFILKLKKKKIGSWQNQRHELYSKYRMLKLEIILQIIIQFNPFI